MNFYETYIDRVTKTLSMTPKKTFTMSKFKHFATGIT